MGTTSSYDTALNAKFPTSSSTGFLTKYVQIRWLVYRLHGLNQTL